MIFPRAAFENLARIRYTTAIMYYHLFSCWTCSVCLFLFWTRCLDPREAVSGTTVHQLQPLVVRLLPSKLSFVFLSYCGGGMNGMVEVAFGGDWRILLVSVATNTTGRPSFPSFPSFPWLYNNQRSPRLSWRRVLTSALPSRCYEPPSQSPTSQTLLPCHPPREHVRASLGP